MNSIEGDGNASNGRERLPLFANYCVAAVWGFTGLIAALGIAGTSRLGIALIPVAIASLRWPTVVRWLMLAVVALLPAWFVGLAHWYFHAVTNVSLILGAGIGLVAHVLLLFGTTTPVRLALGLVALLVYLCAIPGARAESPLAPAACSARVDRLDHRVQTLLAAQNVVLQFRSPTPPKIPTMHGRPPPTARNFLVEVTPSGIWVDRELSANISEAARELAVDLDQLLERRARKGRTDPVGLYVAADASTPVSQVAQLLAPLTQVSVSLLGQSDAGPLGPTPASAKGLADALDHASDAERASLFGRELGQRAGPCAPLAKRMVRLKEQPSSDRATLFAKSLGDGLRECQCSWVDIDALEYLALRMLEVSNEPGLAELPLRRDASGHLLMPNQPGLTVQQWVLQP